MFLENRRNIKWASIYSCNEVSGDVVVNSPHVMSQFCLGGWSHGCDRRMVSHVLTFSKRRRQPWVKFSKAQFVFRNNSKTSQCVKSHFLLGLLNPSREQVFDIVSPIGMILLNFQRSSERNNKSCYKLCLFSAKILQKMIRHFRGFLFRLLDTWCQNSPDSEWFLFVDNWCNPGCRDALLSA